LGGGAPGGGGGGPGRGVFFCLFLFGHGVFVGSSCPRGRFVRPDWGRPGGSGGQEPKIPFSAAPPRPWGPLEIPGAPTGRAAEGGGGPTPVFLPPPSGGGFWGGPGGGRSQPILPPGGALPGVGGQKKMSHLLAHLGGGGPTGTPGGHFATGVFVYGGGGGGPRGFLGGNFFGFGLGLVRGGPTPVGGAPPKGPQTFFDGCGGLAFSSFQRAKGLGFSGD